MRASTLRRPLSRSTGSPPRGSGRRGLRFPPGRRAQIRVSVAPERVLVDRRPAGPEHPLVVPGRSRSFTGTRRPAHSAAAEGQPRSAGRERPSGAGYAGGGVPARRSHPADSAASPRREIPALVDAHDDATGTATLQRALTFRRPAAFAALPPQSEPTGCLDELLEQRAQIHRAPIGGFRRSIHHARRQRLRSRLQTKLPTGATTAAAKRNHPRNHAGRT